MPQQRPSPIVQSRPPVKECLASIRARRYRREKRVEVRCGLVRRLGGGAHGLSRGEISTTLCAAWESSAGYHQRRGPRLALGQQGCRHVSQPQARSVWALVRTQLGRIVAISALRNPCPDSVVPCMNGNGWLWILFTLGEYGVFVGRKKMAFRS